MIDCVVYGLVREEAAGRGGQEGAGEAGRGAAGEDRLLHGPPR